MLLEDLGILSQIPLSRNNPYHPLNIEVYKSIPKENIPDTESLKDTYERVMKFYVDEIQEKLKNRSKYFNFSSWKFYKSAMQIFI